MSIFLREDFDYPVDELFNGFKRCPYCGKFEAKVIENYDSFIVRCQFCTATSKRMDSLEAAIKEWNKRFY